MNNFKRGDKFYAIENDSIDMYTFVEYKIFAGTGFYTGTRRRDGYKISRDFPSYLKGATKDELALNYLYETFAKNFLNVSIENEKILKLFAKNLKKADYHSFVWRNINPAVSDNILTLMDYGNFTNFIILLMEKDIIKANYRKNIYLKKAVTKNYKSLITYLQEQDEVITTAIENNQTKYYPDSVKDIFIF